MKASDLGIRIQHNVEQNSIEWLNLRLGRFTSSPIYKLMSDPKTKSNPYSASFFGYCEEKAAELFYNSDISTFTGNQHTEWGHSCEPEARLAFEKIEGKETKDGGFWTYGECGSSPDFMVSEKEGGEIKNMSSPVNMFRFIRTVKNTMDLKKFKKDWFYQVQHQMYVTGAEKWNFVAYDKRLMNKEDPTRYEKAFIRIDIEPIEEVFKEFDTRIEMAAELKHELLKQTIG